MFSYELLHCLLNDRFNIWVWYFELLVEICKLSKVFLKIFYIRSIHTFVCIWEEMFLILKFWSL